MIKTMQTALVTGAPTTPSARIGRNATFQGTDVVKTAIGLTSVSREGNETILWRNGDIQCGKAVFQPPGTDAFAIVDGALRLRCYPTSTEMREWATGHLQSSDTSGADFSQAKGYWEFEGKMPAAGTKAAWTAFWLYGTELYTAPGKARPEVDIIEYYPGNAPRGHHAALHIRPSGPYQPGEVSKHWNKSSYQGMDAIRDGGWHTYGVEISDDNIIVYMDRKEVCRMPTHEDFLVPLHMLISLQMYSDEWQQATGSIDFFCRYARVYQRAA
jgi:beta-glucanase (GH16 family)